MDKPETVVLRQVWKWQCFACGCVNIVDPPPTEFTDEERAEMLEENGLNDADTGEFVMMPEKVVCFACNKSYDVDMSDIPGVE